MKLLYTALIMLSGIMTAITILIYSALLFAIFAAVITSPIWCAYLFVKSVN